MISILIPIYNFDIRELVHTLHDQAVAAKVPCELICFDDGSAQAYKSKNGSISKLDRVIYRELPENQGRAKIRNLLADAAKYDYLLFMDCDAAVPDAFYVQRYAESVHPGVVLYGGRIYANKKPSNSTYYLHWLVGKNREESSAEERLEAPYHSFMTNNFLIPRSLFYKVRFDERLKQYGHEDTLFGLELKQQGIPILHINNPLEHIGLEPNERFLEKTEQALQNLWFLWKEQAPIETSLLSAYDKLKQFRLVGLAGLVFRAVRSNIKNQVLSSKPSLFWFDLYKLGYFVLQTRKK